jgi:hypothetical protein
VLRLTVAVLVVVLAGTANAEGWRGMRIDGSSAESFGKSLGAIRIKLSPARREVFDLALEDIRAAYTASEYRQHLDGLRYKEVITFMDPTGDTADLRYDAAVRKYARAYTGPAFTEPPTFQQGPPPGEGGVRGGNATR